MACRLLLSRGAPVPDGKKCAEWQHFLLCGWFIEFDFSSVFFPLHSKHDTWYVCSGQYRRIYGLGLSTSSVITGMRRPKPGVSPPRPSPPCTACSTGLNLGFQRENESKKVTTTVQSRSTMNINGTVHGAAPAAY